MIKIGKVIGDVIEAGGVKNVTNNYYDGNDNTQPLPKGGELKEEGDLGISDEDMPAELRGEEAERLMERLVEAGMLDDDWQPCGLSGTTKGEVAMQIAMRLNINNVWQVFGRLWGIKAETLRTSFNKGRDQKKNGALQDELKRILG